jgi:polyisoprenyl-phosphate glycosyltransferase
MNIKQKTFISAVIYICNAETLIENFLKSLYGVLNEHFEKFEIICTNDSSTDATTAIIKKLAGSFNNCTLSILNMSYYQGVEAAMHAGVDLAIGDFVFEFDSTVLDYDHELIMRVYYLSLQGFDIVSCGREHTRSFSKLFYSIYNRYSGTQYKLKSETFRVISRRAINRVHSMSENQPYRKALYSNCGLKVDYIHYKPTNKNDKHMQALKSPYDTALTALILFTNIAYKVTLVFTFIMMAVTLGTAGYVVMIYILGNPVEGYTTMMLLISGAFFAVFAVLTIVIKYLSVILGLIFHKQKYVFESIEKVTG